MGYGEAPWVFKGRALYQLQLVESKEARKHIPANFDLVELFGYTLGGFYLARYDDSPVGSFDELVALAGLVWNAPTSCAWAARVYVNNREARDHGLKSVGLPSRLAAFNAPALDSQAASTSKQASNWWWQGRATAQPRSARNSGDVQGSSLNQLCIMNVDAAPGRSLNVPVCTLSMPPARAPGVWPGPRISLALPSFSGGTPDFPALIKYSCDLMTNVRFVAPARVSVPEESTDAQPGRSRELMSSVLGGRPVLTMAFDDMVMYVEEPERLALPQPVASAAERRPRRRWQGLLGMIPAWGLRTKVTASVASAQ